MNLPMIDWLSLTIDIEDYEVSCGSLLEKLEFLKHQAQENRSNNSSDKVLIDLGPETFEILANGNSCYAYILHSNLVEIRLAKYRSKQKDSFPIYVHFKSECLWSFGPEEAWDWFKLWAKYSLGKIISNKINRADLCCHTDELSLMISDIASFKGKYKKDQLYREGRELTGVDFGSRLTGTVFARIYNKSREVMTSRTKTWFFDIWQNNGLDISKVWNIEFELKRDIFKENQIESCEDFFDRVKDLWQYCTTKWLLMLLLDSTRKERCTPNLFWLTLQDAFNNYKGTSLISREKQTEANKEALLPSVIGFVTSYAALTGIEEPSLAVSKLLQDGNNYLNKRGTSLKHKIKEKRKLKGLEVKLC